MGGYYYTTKAGDMWDYIAWVVYGNEMLMGTLLQTEENRELVTTYLFSAGIKVWCPRIDDDGSGAKLPPWRE